MNKYRATIICIVVLKVVIIVVAVRTSIQWRNADANTIAQSDPITIVQTDF